MRKLVSPLALLLLFVTVANGQDVRYNSDKHTDFSKFKTFKWVEIIKPVWENDLSESGIKTIKGAVSAELKNKGFEISDSESAWPQSPNSAVELGCSVTNSLLRNFRSRFWNRGASAPHS